MKENVAAGILLRAGWPRLVTEGAGFLDPMCGSGTIVIEAALIAAGRAPGLGRDYFGFLGWRGHEPQLWAAIREQALAQVREPPPADPAAAGPGPRCGQRAGRDRQCPARRHRPVGALRDRPAGAGRAASRPGRWSAGDQSALRRALGGRRRRARRAPGTGDRAARALPGLARRGVDGNAGVGAGAGHPGTPYPHHVERRHRVPPAASDRGGGELPGGGGAAHRAEHR